MRYFFNIKPLSKEERNNRSNEIDSKIKDVEKELYTLYCEKNSLALKYEDYAGKKFKYVYNPYHYVLLDIKDVDVVMDVAMDKNKNKHEKIVVAFKLNTPFVDVIDDYTADSQIATKGEDIFFTSFEELYKLEEIL
mgnify:CR=1 FL=1